MSNNTLPGTSISPTLIRSAIINYHGMDNEKPKCEIRLGGKYIIGRETWDAWSDPGICDTYHLWYIKKKRFLFSKDIFSYRAGGWNFLSVNLSHDDRVTFSKRCISDIEIVYALLKSKGEEQCQNMQ